MIAGRYTVTRVLGRGGMGEVLLAEDAILHREVALKQLLGGASDNTEFLERFNREARALARVRHPGVIQVHDFLGQVDGASYLVLEYVPGQSLAQVLAGSRRLPWDRCAEIGAAVCDALTAAHAANVIHRDVKPSNILIEPDGTVRVADFGIARLTDVSATQSGLMLGTPSYMAPEVGNGKRATAQTDLYGLAAVLFEAACGRPPYVSEDGGPAAVLMMHMVADIPDPWDHVPELPSAARDILIRGLQKSPDDRFASAAEMAALLRTSRSPTEVGAAAPTPPAPAPVVAPLATPTPPPVPPGPPSAPAAAADATRAAPGREPAVPPPAAAEDDGPATPDPGPEAPRDTTPPNSTTRLSTPAEPVAAPGFAETRASATPARETPAPAPAPPPVEADGAPAPRRRALLVGGAAVVVALGAGAGILAGSGGDESPPPDSVVALRAQATPAATLRVPADWERVGQRPAATQGLALAGERAFRPARAADGAGTGPREAGLSVGTSRATGARLLPAPFMRRVEGGLPRPAQVSLGGVGALLYPDLDLPGDRSADVYVVPTTRGVVTLTCHAPAAEFAGHSGECRRVAGTLRLPRGVRAFPTGPDRAYAGFLGTALGRMSRDRGRALADVSAARTRAGQADAAARAAAAYAALRTTLGRRQVSPQVRDLHAGLATAAGRASRAYAALAAAARSGSAGGWSSARARALAADRAVAQRVRAMSTAGYTPRA